MNSFSGTGALEDQVKHPLLSSFEMGMGSEEELIKRLNSILDYRREFRLIFKSDGITIDTIAKAIAAYERTLLSANSTFDRFITGNKRAITDAQLRGWELFKGKAKCIQCHTHSENNPLFTDFKFHNTGIAGSNSNLDKLMEPLHLSDNEVNDLVQFMRALTSDDVLRVCQTTKPADAYRSST